MAKSTEIGAAQGAKPKRMKLWPLIIAAVALLAGGGAATWYFTVHQEATAAEAPRPKPPIFIALEPFTVNLQPGGGAQYLQTTVVLKTVEPEAEAAIKAHMPVVRDRILRVLASKRGDELLTVEGKEKLAAEIAQSVTAPFDGTRPQPVEGVLFTSFVIQ